MNATDSAQHEKVIRRIVNQVRQVLEGNSASDRDASPYATTSRTLPDAPVVRSSASSAVANYPA